MRVHLPRRGLATVVLLAATAALLAGSPATRPAGLSGQLLGADGRPLANVQVCLSAGWLDVYDARPVQDGREDPRRAVATTAADGRFVFDRRPANFALIVSTDAGCVLVKRSDLADDGRGLVTLRVQPWASIRGTVTAGGRPVAAGTQVDGLDIEDRFLDGMGPYIHVLPTTDATGRFAVDRVYPGRYQLCRRIMVNGQVASGRPVTVDAVPGRTADVSITVGRAVDGRIGPPTEIAGVPWATGGSFYTETTPPLPAVDVPADLVLRPPAERAAWYAAWAATDPGRQWEAAWRAARPDPRVIGGLRPDGTFHLEDAPAGTQQLTVRFYARPPSGRVDPDHVLTVATYALTVPPTPDGTVPTALAVGTLPPRPTILASAGQSVPDIVFRTADGADHRLSDYRGKVVLLDCWGTWCGACLNELPKVKAIRDAYRSNPDFVMVSLSVGDAEDRWRTFIAKHGMDWPQANLGSFDDAWQAKLLGVTGYPTVWVIGRDGRVVASDYQTALLRPALDAALRPAR